MKVVGVVGDVGFVFVEFYVVGVDFVEGNVNGVGNVVFCIFGGGVDVEDDGVVLYFGW